MAESKQSEQLSASIIMSSDVVFDLYCELCSEEGDHVQAEGFCVNCSDYLCRDCFTSHRKTRASKNHQLLDKATMPQQKPPQPQKPLTSIPQAAAKDTLTEPCEQHPEETIKFYCRDHGVLGCSVCMTVGHRACEGMDYIRDITSDLLASKEYKSFEKELIAITAKSKDIIKNSEENISKAEKCCDEANTTFQQHRNDMIKAFEELGRDVKNETEHLKSADVKKMKDISEKGQGVVSEIEKINSDIHKLQENDQLCQLFITMKQASGKLETLRDVLQTADKENFVKMYKFEPGAEIQQIMNSPAALGRITTETLATETAQDATAGEAYPVNITVKTTTEKTTAGEAYPVNITVKTTEKTTAGEAYPVVPADSTSPIQPSPKATTAVHRRDITVKAATDRPAAGEAYPVVPADTRSQIQPFPATTAVHKRDITVKAATDRPTEGEAYPVVPADTRSKIQPVPATTAVHKKDIIVKTATDSNNCYISGCAFLSNNRLVLTDLYNSKVKLVNLQSAMSQPSHRTRLL